MPSGDFSRRPVCPLLAWHYRCTERSLARSRRCAARWAILGRATTLATLATKEAGVASPVSVRLPRTTEQKVRTLAAIEHRSLAEMVKLLAEEGLKAREFPSITFTDGPTGRRATLVNGPDVWEVIEPYLLAGKDWRALRESYPHLEESALRAAVRYYEAYPDEIEARIALNDRR